MSVETSMSIEATLARIAAIESALHPSQPTTGGVSATGSDAAGTAASGSSALSSPTSGATFSQLLNQATLGGSSSPLGVGSSTLDAGSPAEGVVNVARTQVGQSEMPPGSNESPRITEYRGAVQGSVVGPWCADFASWCAAQAGTPLGENGEGFQSVASLWSWAESSGRAIPATAGTTPEPGDLIVWGSEHVGIVESVDPDGTIHTIEGNSEDQVAQRTYPPGASGATGFVRLG